MKIRKNDSVIIISGKDRGRRGKVLEVFPKTGRVVVDGIALKKKHQRPRKAGKKGEIITLPFPIDASNARLYCGSCNKGVSVGYIILGDDKKKTRVCKKCRNEL